MDKKIRLSVETPFGTVTRTSARPYKFVVVSFGQDEAYLGRRHSEAAAYATRLAAKYRDMAARGGVEPFPGYRQTPEQFTEWAEQAEAKAAAPFVAPKPGLIVHGWSQSRTGAERMAAEAAKFGHLSIAIVPVPQATEAAS